MKNKLLKYILILFLLLIIGIIGIYVTVELSTRKNVFSDIETIPQNRVGLLLGTCKYNKGKYINYYYKYRIEAAVALYHAGKIDYILVSGDNSRKSYDEPSDIKNDLIEKGIPSSRIFLDYAGFRTLDSIIRAKKIFGQTKLTIISQEFHNKRALFISRYKGIDAVAYNAKDVSIRYGKKVIIREYLARVKMVLDLVFGKNPKYLGDRIEI